MLAIASTLNKALKRLNDWEVLCQKNNVSRLLKLTCLLFTSVVLGSSLTSCKEQASASRRSVAIEQAWELNLGHQIEGFPIIAGLGDVSLHLRGAQVRAPFEGETELAANEPQCVYFTSPEVPAYLFRFCGIHRPKLGEVEEGQSMGRATYLHFATLRRQPEGTWAIVEPSKTVLERALERF